MTLLSLSRVWFHWSHKVSFHTEFPSISEICFWTIKQSRYSLQSKWMLVNTYRDAVDELTNLMLFKNSKEKPLDPAAFIFNNIARRFRWVKKCWPSLAVIISTSDTILKQLFTSVPVSNCGAFTSTACR
jgi:hypothetical protein